jgi:HSP20 family protein
MKISDLVPWREREGSSLAARRDSDPLYSLQREVDRLFNEFSTLTPWYSGDRDFAPSVNVTERTQEIEVTAELPGMEEKDIDISIARGVLTIKGEKKQEREETEGDYYRRERRYGAFSRSIQLPTDILDTDMAEAVFKNGVLTIILPKLEEAQQISKRIEVKGG